MKVRLSENILRANLNAEVSYAEFFGALGYDRKEKLYFRFFSDREKGQTAPIREPKLYTLESHLPEFHELNDQNRGVFFVVNGGGRGDLDVTHGRALFIDFDDFDFEEQLRRLNEFPLEPSIIIKTRKSLHCYWILEKFDQDVMKWNELQFRMINYFGSDKSINNPSRVMRLYGFNHCKADPVPVVLVKFDPELIYNMMQFHEVLPRELTDDQRNTLLNRLNDRLSGRRTKRGKVSSSYVKKIVIPEGLSCGFETIRRDERLRWLSRWARLHDVGCNACCVMPDGAVIYETNCPWSNEHTIGDIGTPAAVIVFPSGMYGYHCFHGHCAGRGWQEFREFFEPGAYDFMKGDDADEG